MDGRWKGYGVSLKPGFDPIILAQTPFTGGYMRNALQWGCGLLNLDGCRIACDNKAKFPQGQFANPGIFGFGCRRDHGDLYPESRYPTNVLLDNEAARLLDEPAPRGEPFLLLREGVSS